MIKYIETPAIMPIPNFMSWIRFVVLFFILGGFRDFYTGRFFYLFAN